MKKLLLPALAFVVFLLVINVDAQQQYEEGYYEGGLDDEKVEEMLQNILDNVELPTPSNFKKDKEYIAKNVLDWGDYWDDFEAYLYITNYCGGKVNGTYQKFDMTFDTAYYYGQEIKASIIIYLDNELPSEGCRWSFEHDVNETKSKYDVYQESENRLIAYSINIKDWESTYYRYVDREYEIYCLEYFSIEYHEVYVKVHVTVGVGVSDIQKETKYDKNIAYDIDPDSWIINELESIQLYSSFADDLTNNVKNALQKLIKEEKGEEKQEQEEKQEKQQHVVKNVTIYFEHDFDLKKGEELIVEYGEDGIKPEPIYNVTVEHMATGHKEYFDEFDFISGKIAMDELFNLSLINSTGDGRFRIWIDVLTEDKHYIDRVKDNSLLPQKAFIECDVSTDGKNITKLIIKKARDCWIKVGNNWEILYDKDKKIYNERDGTNGFEVKIRGVIAWERRVRYCIYKFLQESNFYNIVSKANNFSPSEIDDIEIYYMSAKNPGYDPRLDIINLSSSTGNIYRYNSEGFDTLFHEYGHALKCHAYPYVDKSVNGYIGGPHPYTWSVTNIYFAFDEGHSDFFASLLTDYAKEENIIEEQYLAPTDYYDDLNHFGKEGDKIEGAVAGFLLNGLYLNYVKKKYDDAQTKTYEIFAKACELCNKYLKHYPYSIHDVIPFIVAIEPECNYDLGNVDLIWNGGYQCRTWIHCNLYIDEIEGLYGYPLLIAVEPSWFTTVEVKVGNISYTVEEPGLYHYGAINVSDGMACCIFIEKNTRIEADFSQGDGVYIILYDLNGNPMEEILAMYKWIGNATIEFEKDGIKVVKGSVIVKSNSGKTYKAGDKIKITPHSEFVLNVENETALLYVMNGSVGVDNGISYEEVNKNKKAVITEESIDVSSYKDKELEDIWDNFGEAIETLGIEKEEGNGGKQPGFEFVAIAVSLAVIIWLRRKKNG